MSLTRFRHFFLPMVIIFGLVMAQYWPFFVGKTLFFGDNFSLMVPGKLFSAAVLAEGEVPLWNRYLFAGIDWIGDINQSLWYPTTWLFMVLKPSQAVAVTMVSHLVWTGLGMYYLVRYWLQRKLRLVSTQPSQSYISVVSLVVASMWVFSTQMTGSIHNLATLQSLTWVPWVVWVALRMARAATEMKPTALYWSFGLAAVVAVQLLGGYPQHVLYSALLAGGLLVVVEQRKLFAGSAAERGRVWGGVVAAGVLAMVVAVGVTAAVWMPFLETIEESTRSVQSIEQAASGSLQPVQLLKVLVPSIFDHPAAGMKWGPAWNNPANVSLYLTWLGLLLPLVAMMSIGIRRRDVGYIIALSAVVVFAMGELTPLYGFLTQLPILSLTRGASTILFIAYVVWGIWIAESMVRLWPKRGQWLVPRWLLVSGFLALLLGCVVLSTVDLWWSFADVVLGGALSASPFHTVERDVVIGQVIAISAAGAGAAAVAAIWLWKQQRWWLLLLVVAVDMQLATRGMLLWSPAAVYDEPMVMRSELHDPQLRVLTRNFSRPYTDFGAYWDAVTVRAPFSDSYVDSTELAEFNRLRTMRQLSTPTWNVVTQTPVIHGYTTLLPVDVDQTWNQTDQPAINALPMIDITDPATRQRLAQWSVGYYWDDQFFPNDETEFSDLIDRGASSEGIDRLYQLPEALPLYRFENGQAVEFSRFERTTNGLSATINLPAIRDIIIAERYDPDWVATLDGEPITILSDQGRQRLVVPVEMVPDLEVELEWYYRPQAWENGLKISLTTITLVGLAGLFHLVIYGRTARD